MNIENNGLVVALENQMNYERFSEAVYKALAAHYDFINLTGFRDYMMKRAGEEAQHAQKFAEYLADRDTPPLLSELPNPRKDVPIGVFEAGESGFGAALEHEKTVTARLKALYYTAEEAEDPQTCIFLQWFLTEQIEEERTLEEILTKFELARGNGAAILDLNKELGNA